MRSTAPRWSRCVVFLDGGGEGGHAARLLTGRRCVGGSDGSVVPVDDDEFDSDEFDSVVQAPGPKFDGPEVLESNDVVSVVAVVGGESLLFRCGFGYRAATGSCWVAGGGFSGGRCRVDRGGFGRRRGFGRPVSVDSVSVDSVGGGSATGFVIADRRTAIGNRVPVVLSADTSLSPDV